MFFPKQEVAGSTWIVVTLNGRKGFTPIPCNFTSTRKTLLMREDEEVEVARSTGIVCMVFRNLGQSWGCVSKCFRDFMRFILFILVFFQFWGCCRLGIRVHVCVREDFPGLHRWNWGLGPTQPTSSHRGGTFVVLWWISPKKKLLM